MPRNWIRTGACAGLFTALGYLAFAALPLPARLRYLLFFSLPLGGILFVAGLYAALRARGGKVLPQIAALFGIIGFAIMNVLAVVQIAIHLRMSAHAPTAADPAARDLIRWIEDSVNAVHLGLDVSFDIFTLSSFALFGLAGCVLRAATLAFNLYTFPTPPDPDLGPLVGLWLLAVAIRMAACKAIRPITPATSAPAHGVT
jgi:hypothetical protein